MKKTDQDKPLYETPKVSKLDDSDAVYGDGPLCESGSSNTFGCVDGFTAGGGVEDGGEESCRDGNTPTAFN